MTSREEFYQWYFDTHTTKERQEYYERVVPKMVAHFKEIEAEPTVNDFLRYIGTLKEPENEDIQET